MKLNRTGSNWTELERNKINENWDIIEGSYNDVVGQITDEVVGHLIDSAKLIWKEPVDTVEDLPANAEVGETRMVREADPDGISYVYRYDGEKWEKIQAIDVTLVNEVDSRLSSQLAEKVDRTSFEESPYYENVKVTKHFDEISETTYYLTLIKNKDEDGNFIKLKHGVMPKTPITIREFANNTHATVATNASWTVGQRVFSGVTIKDGVVLDYTPNTEPYRHTLGIKEDNTLVSYPPNFDPATMISDGVINATTAFIPLIEGGLSVGTSLLNLFHMPEKHPRQAISQFENKDIMFLTCGGRGFDGEGMTASDVVRILLNHGVTFAYMLDGGGSVSTVYRGMHINKAIDDNGSKERSHANTLYIEKEVDSIKRDNDIKVSNANIGVVNHKVDANYADLVYKISRKAYKSIRLAEEPILINDWGGTLYANKNDLGQVHLFGVLTVGDIGSIQSNITTLTEEFHPKVIKTGVISKSSSPYDSYVGLTISRDGGVRLRGDANANVVKGDRIQVDIQYQT